MGEPIDGESSVLLTVVLLKVDELLAEKVVVGSVIDEDVLARVVRVAGISGSVGVMLVMVVALTGADMNSVIEVA